MKKKGKNKKRIETKKTSDAYYWQAHILDAEILGGTVFIRRVQANTREKAYTYLSNGNDRKYHYNIQFQCTITMYMKHTKSID